MKLVIWHFPEVTGYTTEISLALAQPGTFGQLRNSVRHWYLAGYYFIMIVTLTVSAA
jgi:hypothetical protein